MLMRVNIATVKNPKKYNDEVIFPDKVKINLITITTQFLGDLKIIINTILEQIFEMKKKIWLSSPHMEEMKSSIKII